LRSVLDADGEIEHVGSTAVEGMDAKPIVDVLVLVDDFDEAEALTPRLEALGYERRRESDPVSGRVFFAKGAENDRTHYLSVAERGGERHVEQVLLRAYLREYPATAAEYRELKHELAAEHPDDRASYTAEKAPFIERVFEAARTEREGTTMGDRRRHRLSGCPDGPDHSTEVR
jgi:GrpB-like predicted nucleotidyltransferase (UPF0157 family)